MKEIEKQIIDQVEERKNELLEYLGNLVSFPSENEGVPDTGRETELQNFIYDDMLKSGFSRVEKISAKNDGHRPNVLGVIEGSSSKSPLMLNAHADVVPVKDIELKKWKSDPYKATVRDGKVYGRGTSDCKGGLASMVLAAKILKDLKVNLKNDLYVMSAVGEESQEGQTIGTALALERGYKPAFAVIGEPSNCEIHIESSGNFLFELKILGKEAHCAARNQVLFPQRFGIPSGYEIGVDAIDKEIAFIMLMQKIEWENSHKWKTATTNSGGYPIPMDNQGLGFFTITPAQITGGQYIGAVSGYANIIFNVWYPNWLKEEDVAMSIKEKIMHLAATDEWLSANPPEFIYPTIQHWRPFKTPMEHPGVRLIEETYKDVLNQQPIYSSFRAVCDGTFLQEKGVSSIVFGPGGLNMSIHGPNEFVPIEELIKCAKTYAVFAYRWCNNA